MPNRRQREAAKQVVQYLGDGTTLKGEGGVCHAARPGGRALPSTGRNRRLRCRRSMSASQILVQTLAQAGRRPAGARGSAVSSGTSGRFAVCSARRAALARRSAGAARSGAGCTQGASKAGLRCMRWPPAPQRRPWP